MKDLKKLLEELLKKDESDSYIEFKTDIEPSLVGEYISALSNSACLKHRDFGYLVFGIEDKSKKIVGTKFDIKNAKIKSKNNKNDKESLELYLRRMIEPRIFFDFYDLEIEEKKIVILEIESAKEKPTKYEGKGFCRINESKTSLDSLPAKFIKKIYNSETDWSLQVPDKEYSFDDLDEEAVERACKLIISNNSQFEQFKNSPKTLLKKAKILSAEGEIVNATMLLLGKSEFGSDFGEIKIKFPGWRSGVGEVGGAETFTIPFLTEVPKIYLKIRNDKIKTFPDGSLFPNHDVIDKYDKEACLEAINNCIAHNDYFQAKIIAIHQCQNQKLDKIKEEIDYIDFESNGNFYYGKPYDYLDGKGTPKKYRNKFLAEAMKTLKMGVDVSGKGIGFIYQKQIDKYFPIPDFISRNEGDYEEIFVLRIYGKVIDKKFSEILRNHPSFDIPKIILLDKIQKGLGNEIDENDVKKLQKEKLIEGRKPNYILSMKVAEILGEEVEYTRRKGFSDDEVIDIIIKHLKNFPNGKSRLQIDELAEKYLSTTLNSDKKRAKIKYILSKMKKKNLIKNFGSDKKPFYKLIL